MKEVSIIINGVRYDIVDAQCDIEKVCEDCDLVEFCDNIPYILLCQVFDAMGENIHFKKSTKSFER